MKVIRCPWCGCIYPKSGLKVVLVSYPLFGPGSIWQPMRGSAKSRKAPDLDFYCPECTKILSRVYPVKEYDMSLYEYEANFGVGNN